jgi:hypothetical protein
MDWRSCVAAGVVISGWWWTVPPPYAPMEVRVQSLAAPVGVTSPDDEDAWLDFAQSIANQRGEAVAVVQGGRFVCVLNPRK